MRSAYDLETPRRQHWTLRAACHGYDPEWWAVVGTKLSDANKAAMAICGRCPVKVRCKQWGIDSGAAGGVIYGGEVMPVGVQTPGPLSTAQAALLANCTTTTIRAALDEGRLRGWRTDKGWRIDPAVLDEYVRGRR